MEKNEILCAYGSEYKEMIALLFREGEVEKLLREKAESMGKKPEEMKIGLKPNLVSCVPASLGATTHPELVGGVTEFLWEAGCRDITVIESSWVGGKTEEAFDYCGYYELRERYGIRLVDVKKEPWDTVEGIKICRTAREMDFLINMPVLKGHCQTRVTCAMKNLKGLLPDEEKRNFHRRGLYEPIARLSTLLRPDIILTDAICGDPACEDGGHPYQRNGIFLSRDPVLTDAYAATLLGYKPEEIQYIPLAAELGAGSMELAGAKIRVLAGTPPKEIPDTRRFLTMNYACEAVDSCSACYSVLMSALDRLREEEFLDKIPGKVAIGQGYRGKTGELGVGQCTRLFRHSVPGCPPSEDKIYEELKKLICSRENIR